MIWKNIEKSDLERDIASGMIKWATFIQSIIDLTKKQQNKNKADLFSSFSDLPNFSSKLFLLPHFLECMLLTVWA